MRRLATAAAVIGTFSLVNIVVALVRGKYAAFMLGPDGVGLLAQATMFLSLATTVATLSMGTGIIRYVSQYQSTGEESRLGDVIHSSITLQIGLAVILVAGVLVAVRPLSHFLFASVAYAPWVALVALAIPLMVLASGLGGPLFYGFLEYGTYTRVAIMTAVGGLVPFVLLIAFLGVRGAFISLVVVACWGAGVNLWYLHRRIPFRPLFRLRLVTREVKGLLSYGAAGFAGGVMGLLALLYMRSLVVRDLGLEANGYYQVVYAIHNLYLVLLTNGLWGHYYPAMCQAVDNTERVAEINRAVRFSLLCFIPIVAGLMAFRQPIVYLVYSSEFLPATRLFPLQLLGDGFFLVAYILNGSLLALGALRAYISFAVCQNLMWVAVFWLFMPRFGILGLVGAYLVSYVVFAAFNYAYHVKVLGLRLESKNRQALSWSLAVLVAMALMPGGSVFTIVVPLALLGLWAAIVVEKRELREAFAMVRGWLASPPSQEAFSSDGL
ncbi:oligosaccharide flippase family protein [Nitrospinae bacterium AH_259_B05_G02_I21]|nr:oligosaccharide flippase family protein [Nitrospinae bacterium AH_259_B05_G02_I21]MDA2931913.1 oligosaccharide flippase family protein [Nitrospinae bacterium AH-259-F20]